MKLARTTFPSGPAAAAAVDGTWVRLAALGVQDHALLTDPGAARRALECADFERLRAAGDAVAVEGAPLLAPLQPGKLLAIGLNYRDHAEETGAELPVVPLLFGKFASSVTGPFADVAVPRSTQRCDYEAELAVVIGRPARDVSAAEALSHVAAYSVANDVSARDVQFAEPQWTRSKSFDGFCPLGPWLTTADDVSDPSALRVRSWVNGELRQDSTTAQLIFGIGALIAFLSQDLTLQTGDVILTGTPAGVAMGMPGTPWLQPGDVVRCAIDGLGEIENHFTAPA